MKKHSKYMLITRSASAALLLVVFLVLNTVSSYANKIEEPLSEENVSVSQETKADETQSSEETQNDTIGQVQPAPAANNDLVVNIPEITPYRSADVLSLPSISTFSLDPLISPSEKISPESLTEVENIIHDIEQDGITCGFVVIAANGTGLSHNPSWECYSASTAKMMLAYYICSYLYPDEAVSEEDATFLSEAIMYSDNASYDSLCFKYYNQDFIDWLWRNYHIAHEINNENGAYPYASAESMAAMWTDIARFMDSEQANAILLSNLTSNTEVSFIRNGVTDTKWTVRNKAGWIDEYAEGENSTSDCAVLDRGEQRLIMIIMTSQPVADESTVKVAELARLLASAICG